MTVADALSAVRRVGTIENCGGNLRLQFPETAVPELQPAIEALRSGKTEALALLSDQVELARASAILNRVGVRILALKGGAIIGVWSDVDGPDVRDRSLVCYLDESEVPVRYKVRWAEGNPVPLSVLAEMKRHRAEPWNIRDPMLNGMGWCSKWTARVE